MMVATNNVKIGFVNINGVRNKVDRVREVIVRENIDVMCIVETWLEVGDNAGIRPLAVDIRKDRIDGMSRGSGGILVIVRQGVSCRVIEIDTNKNWVLLEVEGVKVACCYYSPSAPLGLFRAFLDKMNNIASNEDEKLIICGDMNARMKEMTGDSCNCTRGRWMKNFLRDSHLTLRQPNIGKWTSWNSKGRGITDLILIPRTTDVIKELRVLEKESVGGSDHRCITMSLEDAIQADDDNSPARWNLTKLSKPDVQESFTRLFNRQCHDLFRIIDDVKATVRRLVNSKAQVTAERRQQLVETVWLESKKVMVDTLEHTCGKRSNALFVNKDFHTETMARMQREVAEAEQAAQEAIALQLPRVIVRNRWRRYGDLKSQWVRRTLRRKTVVFRKSMDLLENPSQRGTLLKMVNGMQRRDKRSTSGLSKDNMVEHTRHFNTTFGAPPEGHATEIDRTVLDATDPKDTRRVKKHGGIPEEIVTRVIKEIARGKAAGIDGLPGEVWLLANERITSVLRHLFTLCEQLGCIPEEWKQCLVVLIYKNKGSNSDVANYRPISLTCVIRRLYEKVVKRLYDRKVERRLTIYQGGFRRQRSTYDQILRLNEMIANSPKAIITFLDIQAAYDCVDRRILWTLMHNKFRVSKHCIGILRSLFDENSSMLLVEGMRSDQIVNARGLLQGSSLSPGLFNAYINGLSEVLSEQGGGLKSRGEQGNNLLFADDSAITSSHQREAQDLLEVSELWAISHGIKFKPAKCKVIVKGLVDVELELYGERLETVEGHDYLGVKFTSKGIDWKVTMAPRLEAATNRIHWMKSKGMNAFGWRPSMSLAVYKSFIRPMMEYGLAVAILPKGVITMLQQVQNMALRKILGVGNNTSILAMHVMCNIEMMASRNQILNLVYFQRVLSPDRANLPASLVVSREMELINRLKGSSMVKRFVSKNYWGTRVKNGEDISKVMVQASLNTSTVGALASSSAAICQRIHPDIVGSGDVIILDAGGMARKDCWYLWQWKLGLCGGKWRICHHCQQELSSEHFLSCGNALDTILALEEVLLIEDVLPTLRERMDRLLQLTSELPEPRRILILKQIASSMEQCRVITMDWQLREDPYSDDEDPEETYNVRLRESRRSRKQQTHRAPVYRRR